MRCTASIVCMRVDDVQTWLSLRFPCLRGRKNKEGTFLEERDEKLLFRKTSLLHRGSLSLVIFRRLETVSVCFLASFVSDACATSRDFLSPELGGLISPFARFSFHLLSAFVSPWVSNLLFAAAFLTCLGSQVALLCSFSLSKDGSFFFTAVFAEPAAAPRPFETPCRLSVCVSIFKSLHGLSDLPLCARVARWSSRSCSGDFPRQTRRRSHADLSFQASSGVCFHPSHVAVCSPLFLSPFTRHQTTLPSSPFSRSFASSPFSPNVSASPVFSSRPLSPPFFSYRSLSSSLLFSSKSPLDWSRGSPLLSFPPSCGLSASAPSLRTYSSAGRHSSPFPVSSRSSLFAASSGPSSASLFSPSLCFRRVRNACSRFFSRDASPPSEPSLSLDLLPTLLLSAMKNQNLLLKHTQLVAQKVQCFLSRATHLLARNLREARILLQPVLHLLLVHHHPLFLAASHLIRFFKVLLYLRYLFDWLPQVNPHLPPFTFVYRATDTYISVFTRVVPSIASMDLSGFAAWAVLEMTENYLARIIATLE